MGILLTDKERQVLYHSNFNVEILIEEVAKAQLKKVVKELCPHVYEVKQDNISQLGVIPVVILHKKTWQALLKEVRNARKS